MLRDSEDGGKWRVKPWRMMWLRREDWEMIKITSKISLFPRHSLSNSFMTAWLPSLARVSISHELVSISH
jgi:hypothetical protein